MVWKERPFNILIVKFYIMKGETSGQLKWTENQLKKFYDCICIIRLNISIMVEGSRFLVELWCNDGVQFVEK